MTIEEFYQSCQNCGWKNEFDHMKNQFRNLHVSTFEVRKDKVRIQVRVCVR